MNRSEVDEALPAAQVGDVGDPQDVRAAGLKSRSHEVVGDAHARHADGGAAALSLHKARDPGLSHEPLDTLAADPDPVAEAQLGVDPPCAVDAPSPVWICLILSVSHASWSARSDGGRRSKRWNAVLFTPSAWDISETGYEAFSAAMKR